MSGFGYIVPATFLPAAAQEYLPNSNLFAWVWPAFGLTAALSTLLSARLLSLIAPRKLWITAQCVMAIGVASPALCTNGFTLLVCALCVGGSFMAITMAATQEAWRVAGNSATRLMASMTTSFALGQFAGPLLLPNATQALSAMQMPGLIAAGLMLLPLPWLAKNR
jgi:MFS family permease